MAKILPNGDTLLGLEDIPFLDELAAWVERAELREAQEAAQATATDRDVKLGANCEPAHPGSGAVRAAAVTPAAGRVPVTGRVRAKQSRAAKASAVKDAVARGVDTP